MVRIGVGVRVVVVMGAVVVGGGFLGGPAWGTDFYWDQPGGGAFGVPTNWSPLSPPSIAGPGGASDIVHFSLGASAPNPYLVAGVRGQNLDVEVDQDSVTLNFSGNYSVEYLEMGLTAGPNTNLVLTGNGSAVFSSEYGYIGEALGAEVNLTVNNLQWTSTGLVTIGARGTGTVTLQSGSSLAVPDLTVGEGALNVSGVGSSCTSSDTLTVGFDGSGFLNITGGGVLTDVAAFIGGTSVPSGIGTVTVSGAGSVWTTQKLTIGDVASGTVNITKSGVLNASEATTIGSQGVLNLDGGTLNTQSLVVNFGGEFHWTAGTLHVTQSGGLEIGAPGPFFSSLLLNASQTLQVDHGLTIDGGTTLFSGGGLSAGSVTIAAKGQLFSGGPTPNFGTGVVNHGDLVFTAATTVTSPVSNASDGRITTLAPVTFTGAVSGAGNFYGAGKVTFAGGYSAAASITFEGPVALAGTNSLLLQLGGTGAGQYGQLNVAGELDVGGTLGVSLVNGFQIQPGEEFVIADGSGGETGQFTGLGEGARVGNFGGVDLFVTYGADGGNAVALYTAVPEPATLAVLGCVGLLGLKRRRARG